MALVICTGQSSIFHTSSVLKVSALKAADRSTPPSVLIRENMKKELFLNGAAD